MLKFFRKIRQNLVIDSKADSRADRLNKYLLYAIGEIILVVVGILIALQINNWNKQREEGLLEIKILEEIRTNLELDLLEIPGDILHMDSVNWACINFIDFVKNNESPSKEFYKIAGMVRVRPHFDPNVSGYELLVAKGVGAISNDSLRNAISQLYETAYPYYRRYEDERLSFSLLHVEPKLLEYFTKQFRAGFSYEAEFKISLADFIKLKNDNSATKLISSLSFENEAVLPRAHRTEKTIQILIRMIENELQHI